MKILLVIIFICLVNFSVLLISAKKMGKGDGGGSDGDDWEAYPTGGKCNCNCGGGEEGKTKVIAMEKVIKVPRIRIIDMGKKDDLHFMKSKSMVGMVMASPEIETMDDEPMDSWSS